MSGTSRHESGHLVTLPALFTAESLGFLLAHGLHKGLTAHGAREETEMNADYVRVTERAFAADLERCMYRAEGALYIRPRGPWGSYKGLIEIEYLKIGPNWTKVIGRCPSTGQRVERTWPPKCTFRVFRRKGAL